MLGTKIKNLYLLKDKGFNVPPFYIIKQEDVLDKKKIDDELKKIKNKKSKEVSKILKQRIRENIKVEVIENIDSKKYAVRSSCNIEDGKTSSFAGQFDTFLNVDKKHLKKKIIECFESLYNENVLDYIKEKKLSVNHVSMNVIVQEMVPSEYSGIIFTANPQGILNESVIVVGKGLGENVVSDKVKTTTYYYNLTDNLYYYEGKKDILKKETIEKLIKISKEIEETLGKDLDIEFAILKDKIYILQARKITTITRSNPLILDNSNIVESYPNISLPLTCSFVNIIYSGVFRGVSKRILKNDQELKKHEEIFNHMVGSVNGRIYYKISNWYQIIEFLPFSSKIIPIWQEMLGVQDKNYENKKKKLPLKIKIMTYFNSIYELMNTEKNMEKLNQEFIKINQYFYNHFKENSTKEELKQLYDEVKEKLLKNWDITLLNDLYTFIFTALVKRTIKKKYSNYEEISNQYISGITNIESIKPIRELINLAYDKDKLDKNTFQKRKEDYIKIYGDRNLEELKLESKTFRSDPKLLDEKIKEYRKDLEKLKELHKQINEPKEPIIKDNSKILNFYSKKCLQGIKNREISRLNRSRIFGMVREIFLSFGKIYQKENIIKEEKDIFYLTVEEVFSLIDHKKDMKEIVKSRKRKDELNHLLPNYTRLIFAEKEFDKTPTKITFNKKKKQENELMGIPCSDGKVIGEVLVVEDINKVKNTKDKILITKMTDPGWVFLLATAKGVISEKGSILSHTAIISRELKVPSIVGVENLLATVSTKDIIEMDGSTGKIKIIKKSR